MGLGEALQDGPYPPHVVEHAGAVLVALARVLDLELELVPKKAVPAVKSIVRSSNLRNSLAHGNPAEDVKASLPAYSLDGGDDE